MNHKYTFAFSVPLILQELKTARHNVS